MMQFYKYLFYTALQWQRRFWPNDPGTAALNAFYLLLLVTWWSVLVLVMIVECIFGVRLLPKFGIWEGAVAMAGLAQPLYFLLLHRGAAKRITAQFEGESLGKARLHASIAVGYFVISFALLIVMALIRAKVLPRP
jgi:hypothetical protein